MKKAISSTLTMAAGLSLTASAQHTQKQPNIILIMCDDMGFSDLGCYGSEVETPNIDLLAQNGTRFTQMKNAGRSCPSRASLLTGYYPHAAGMGWMTAVDEHRKGYRGQIADNIPTLAEVLRSAGYATYMSGKWHVTVDGAFDGPNGSYPVQRGFDHYYGSLSGGGSYYTPKALYHNTDKITRVPDDYYYTTAITDTAVSYINRHNFDQPMFMYVAHYAPHLPLEAPKDRVEKCKDRYKVGYDILKQARFAQLKKEGLIPQDMTLPLHEREFNGKRPSWNELSDKQQQQWINDMATYAAMIEIMDDGIGALVQTLKEKGEYDNTIFLFLSDNGSTSEGGFIKQLMADLSNTPYRSYKQWCYQGGTSTPLIIAGGKDTPLAHRTGISKQAAHIIDLFPTCINLASVSYPKKHNGNKVSLQGTSLLPALKGKQLPKRDLYFEHQTSCAIISDGWKLVRGNGKKDWELINLNTDPFEQNDLSQANPAKVAELEKRWNKWAHKQNVFPFEYLPWTERINHYKKLNPDQRGE